MPLQFAELFNPSTWTRLPAFQPVSTHTDVWAEAPKPTADWPMTFDYLRGGYPFFTENHNFLLVAACLYVPLVFGGLRIMKNREAFELKTPLILWNVIMTVFSGVGAFYTVIFLYQQFAKRQMEDVVCDVSCYTTEAGRWVFLFNASKIFEWIDTLFLILRKKPVIFLHWVHHILTMVFCWHMNLHSARSDCSGMVFAAMNLAVHTLMYSYYLLAALGQRPKWGEALTLGQTLQMVVGIWVLVVSMQTCDLTWIQNWHGTVAGLAMYFLYFVLFARLLIKKVTTKRAPRGPKPETKKGK